LVSGVLLLDTFTIKEIYSPKISVDKGTILSDTEYVGLYLDESNYQDRASLYVDYSGFEDVSSSLILHLNEDDLNFGLILSYIFGNWIYKSDIELRDVPVLQKFLNNKKEVTTKELLTEVYVPIG